MCQGKENTNFCSPPSAGARPLARHHFSAFSADHFAGDGDDQRRATLRTNGARRCKGVPWQPRFFDRALRKVRGYGEEVDRAGIFRGTSGRGNAARRAVH